MLLDFTHPCGRKRRFCGATARPDRAMSLYYAGMRIRHFFPRIRIRLGKNADPDPAEKNADPDPTLNRNEEKIYS